MLGGSSLGGHWGGRRPREPLCTGRRYRASSRPSSPSGPLEISLPRLRNHSFRRTSLHWKFSSLMVGVKCIAISKYSIH